MHRSAATLALVFALLAGACAAPGARPRADDPHDHHPDAPHAWRLIGRSVDGCPIEARTVGEGPRRVYLVALIHGDEPEGFLHLHDLLDALDDDALARAASVRVVANMNPDGLAAGTRANARGVDLNRNWPTANFEPGHRHGRAPASEPETAAVLRDVEFFDPELIVVLHSSRRGPYVNFDGPALATATAFAAAASTHGQPWRVEPSVGYPTPGSLGTWAGIERKIPILTVEFRRGQDPALALEEARAAIPAAVRAFIEETP